MRRRKIKGKQSKLVTVPVKAKSSKTHPEVHLAYITDKEQDLLIKKDLYKSLKGKPNRGPGGVPSLEGDFGSPTGSTYSPAEGPDVSAQTATGEGGQTYTRTGGTKGTISTGNKNALLLASLAKGNWVGAGANIFSRFSSKKKEPTLTERTAAMEDAYVKPKSVPVGGGPGDRDGTGGTQIATTGAQPVKKKPFAMKPYHMGFDFQKPINLETHKPLPTMKRGGLSGGERFGPPPKKGPNPHGKCPFRPDGIRGVGAVEPGRGVKFIGTK